nr:zinc finger protein [Hymenolepis microstoma]
MSKVASLPATERQMLLNKIKKSIDQTEAICSESSCNGDDTYQTEVIQTTTNTPSIRTSQRKLPLNSQRRRAITSNTIPTKPLLVLACPVCELKFTNWTIFSNHLHTGHSQSTVSSVCRRCHGIFRNHALLLAHECFKWGRSNLPCSTVYSSIEDSPILKDFGFPSEGIYFERRCGLCLTSDVVYSNFEQYEKHKYEEHAESGSRAPICDIQRPQNKSFQAPASALLPAKPQRKIKKSKVEKPVTATHPAALIHTEEVSYSSL